MVRDYKFLENLHIFEPLPGQKQLITNNQDKIFKLPSLFLKQIMF